MSATNELLDIVKLQYKACVAHFLMHNDGITEPGVFMTEEELEEYADDYLRKITPNGVTPEFTQKLLEMGINLKHENQS